MELGDLKGWLQIESLCLQRPCEKRYVERGGKASLPVRLH